jgi:hypothetical protein
MYERYIDEDTIKEDVLFCEETRQSQLENFSVLFLSVRLQIALNDQTV